jgi:hypothetical protein
VQAVGRPPQRAPDGAPLHYARHRPEQTTLYRLVQQHAASFIAHSDASTRAALPRFIKVDFDAVDLHAAVHVQVHHRKRLHDPPSAVRRAGAVQRRRTGR